MKILILGNGFDLDLGLKTKYSNFAISPEWKGLYESFKCTSDDNLAGFLKKKAEEDNWFAIEDCLKQYAQMKIKENDFEHVNEDESFFELLKEHLETYLTLVSQDGNEKGHLATKLLDWMNEEPIFDKIYSFNYISHDALHKWCGCDYERDVCYVHQKLYCGIVLGVAERDITDDRYSFLRKVSHPSYPPSNLCMDLMKANEVVIYGHSLNNIDFDYFKDYFNVCSKYDDKRINPRQITVISRDDKSVQDIKNNLISNGIVLTALNQYSQLTFIALDNYYKGESAEVTKVKDLMNRLGIAPE